MNKTTGSQQRRKPSRPRLIQIIQKMPKQVHSLLRKVIGELQPYLAPRYWLIYITIFWFRHFFMGSKPWMAKNSKLAFEY